LKTLCSDSGECVSFGREAVLIKKHFKGFADFSYLIGTAKTIGAESANGFVKELTYEYKDYVAHSILKSSKKADSDNLFYEGIVGQYINRMALVYPCFLETYGIYKYATQETYESMRDNKHTNIDTLAAALIPLDLTIPNILYSCQNSIMVCINTQHLQNVFSINDYFDRIVGKTKDFTHYFCYELINILYQIYMPLSMMANNFTHYDLHGGNVLLYNPGVNRYITYHYHLPDGTVTTFHSEYLIKIIDYGRCFFNDPDNPGIFGNSARFYTELCKECFQCGYDEGFSWLERSHEKGTKRYEESFYISSTIPNRSHDLRLMNGVLAEIIPYFKDEQEGDILYDNFREVNDLFQDLLDFKKIEKGTREKASTKPTKKNPLGMINNVHDMFRRLNALFKMEKYAGYNNTYYSDPSQQKIGDMYIYTDGRLINFVPV
jgi:hypothetical protein